MTVRKKRRHIVRTESKAHVNDYVKFLILDKKGFFSFKHIFRIFAAEKESAIDCTKNSSYKFSTATAIRGCLKQTTIKNN